jgi:hypothetical protein
MRLLHLLIINQNKSELEAENGANVMQGESHGLSIFFRMDNAIFHTYSTYAVVWSRSRMPIVFLIESPTDGKKTAPIEKA